MLPKIDDASTGEPHQRVALRLVPLITQLPVKDILTWLSEPPMEGMNCILTAYEHVTKGNPRTPTAQMYKAIRADVIKETRLKKQLALLPASHYVYSDELARSFTRFIDLFMSREDAAAEGMGLIWNVALGPYAGLIGECPSFVGAEQSKRERGKLKTAARHEAWRRLVLEKKFNYPSRSHRDVCRLVAIDLKGQDDAADAETIRKVTRL